MSKKYSLTTCKSGGIYRGDGESPYFTLVGAEAKITELHIEDGCQRIEEKALEEREELCRLSIPPSVKTIGFMAFYGCSSLSGVSFPEGIEKIEDCAFYDCALTEIELPEGLTHIGKDAFSIIGLTGVILPNTVSYIGDGAFTHNPLPYNTYEGGYYVGSRENPYLCFMKPRDAEAEKIELHKDTRIIYSKAFMGCKRLSEIILPEGLLQIGRSAFLGASSLKKIKLPEGLKLICEEAFSGCHGLAEIKFPESCEIESGAFIDCISLEDIDLGAASVGDFAFEGCENLRRVCFSSQANLWGEGIFDGCELLS